MNTDLNWKLLNTKSTKLRKVTSIRKLIIDIINENQSIKRYMRFTTKMPLAKKSIDNNGNVKVQNDIVNSLLIDSNEGEQCLFSGSFNPEMSNIQIPYIFVHSYRTRVRGSDSTINFAIHIVCPQKYNTLQHYGDERIYEIGEQIIELLDGYTIENSDIAEVTGNVTFICEGDIEEYRLSKTSDIIVLTIPIVVRNVAMRSRV